MFLCRLPWRAGFSLLATVAMVCLSGCVQTEDTGDGRRLARLSEVYGHSQADNPLPESPLTLENAIEYALCHNLQIRAAELEFAIQHEAKSAYYLRMLPSLNVRGGVDHRGRHDATTSQTIGGPRSTIPSMSDDDTKRTADITLVWSLLDFGLSYVRAYQFQENVIISGEQLRRLRQQVAMETAAAYYRAAAAAETLRECASLGNAINVQLNVVSQEAELRNISGLDEARRSLPFLTGLRRIEDLKNEEMNARMALAKAMGLTRPDALQFAPVASAAIAYVPLADADALVCQALANRPEMRQGDSQVRISEAEAKATLLQIAPNVNLSGGYNYDSNSYNLYNNWLSAGLSMSWNLLSLPARLKDHDVAKRRIELERQRERITAASIVMQVHLALLEMSFTENRLRMGERITGKHRAILQGIEDSIRDGKGNEADLLMERMRYINEFANLSKNRADYLAARMRMVTALGVDPVPSQTLVAQTVTEEGR